ncbi:MAG: hypothetical protein GF398_13300 [Chitinivibrionales bacterium]|nr:hypothetical protein [Chitinivibrionales bacterium]
MANRVSDGATVRLGAPPPHSPPSPGCCVCLSPHRQPARSWRGRTMRRWRPFILLPALLATYGCLSSSVRYSSASTTETPVRPDTEHQTRHPQTSPAHEQLTPDRLKEIAESYLGVPYRKGGISRAGFDCSGYVCTVYREYNQTALPRTTREMKKLGHLVPVRQARRGDLVFFTGRFARINHVGIYMDDGIFIHASTKKGVTYSKLDNVYYKKHFAFIRRIE